MALHDELDTAIEMSRREILTLLGAGMAFAGVGGCERIPAENILPYSRNPPELTPGIPVYYATTMLLDGYGTGLLVKSSDGRPTKIEGNPDHPASLGAAGVFEQASVLELYDPARARSIRSGQANVPFGEFALEHAAPRSDGGAGLRFLMEPTSSTLTRALIDRVLARHPSARFTMVSPVRHGHTEEGARLCFGQRLSPLYDLRQARVILSLDADFLGQPPFHLAYARQFAERRNPDRAAQGGTDPGGGMVRLYVIEAMPSITGSMADHRLARPSRDVGTLAATIAAELVLGLGARPAGLTGEMIEALAPYRSGPDGPWVAAVARDLLDAGPGAVVIVGERQPPEVHAVGHLIQAAIAAGPTQPRQTGQGAAMGLIEPVLIDPGPAAQDLAALTRDMAEGRVETLVMLGGNPVYTVPADLRFGRALARVPRRIYLGLYEDETAEQSTWFLPATHMLESWGDARAYDGTESFIQPLIVPFYGGKATTEVLSVFAGELNPSAYSLLREHVARRPDAAAFDVFFQSALKRGVIPGTQAPRVTPPLEPAGVAQALRALAARSPSREIEASFLPDPSAYDGRFTQNAWLLELPRPITKLTWGNAAMLSPTTARRLGIETEHLLELTLNGRTLRAPALIVPGHADDSITLPLGYGREGAIPLARGVGFNAYRLRSSSAPSFQSGLAVKPLAERQELARTQGHWTEEGRPIALTATLSQYRENPLMFRSQAPHRLSLMPEVPATGNQWAMAIDLSICTGCSACVVACQAENNTMVVGKEGVMKSREMHWLRIDSYREAHPSGLQIVHQPMLCQHCEMAPCEYVCPVNATVHSPDGLNEMAYNRCIGTRACSNNCPYKVRRFNWFDWIEREAANQGSVMLQRNPQVTVRERGVMEKCTYCVQRIRSAGIQAQIENRPIREGEVVTACQQACPTRAIEFGSLAFADSEVVRRRENPRNYEVLGELGTRPRTTYLAMIKNPHPELT
jgi:molybdopterin-containing oxidoreductase family iron-sulfur binding subunit